MGSLDRFIRYEIAIILAVLAASIAIIWQFFTPLLLALITAYLLYPLVKKVQKHVYFYDAAIIVTVLLLLAPLVVLINYVAGDVGAIISSYGEWASQVAGFLSAISNYAAAHGLQGYVENVPKLVGSLSEFFRQKLLNTLSNLPHIMLSIVMYLAGTYFMLKDGYKINALLVKFADSMNTRDRDVVRNLFIGLKNSFDVLFFAHVGMPIVSGILAGIGFYIFGVPYPAVFATLVTLFAILPLIGTWIAYTGAALMLYAATGNVVSSILAFSWGAVFGTVLPDFILKPWLGSKIGNVHPLTIIVGFFGGPFVFGIKGFILGPIILVIAETVLKGFIEVHTKLNNRASR